MTRNVNRCEYVLRQAGHSVDGRPIAMDGYGDTTRVCGNFGSVVPHTYYTRKPGTTTVMIAHESTTVRCPEHEALV